MTVTHPARERAHCHPHRHRHHRALAAATLAIGAGGLIGPATAAVIADNDPYAWSENAGWLNFKAENGNVQVYADHLEGYIWHQNLGWIRLGTYTDGGSHRYTNTSETNYGVNRNTSTGALSGYAWSENAGWLNFGATDGNASVERSSGAFSGAVWSQNVGWISLSGTVQDATSTPYGVGLAQEAGACGDAADVATLQPPSSELCAGGFPGTVTSANGVHRWTCAGISGGADAQCSASGGSDGGGGGGGGGDGTVTFVASAGGCTVEEAQVISPPRNGPAGLVMPYGVVDFSLSGCSADSATVELTFSGPVAGLTYWKYIDDAWTPMTDGVTLAGNTATLTIADNGPFDADDSKGSIDDPSGPAAPPEPIPTLSVWGLLASAGLLGLFGAWRQRRRR
ncbi:IPTL-CTERM sorting domain-containing protein [uncultured Thiohalocapsa sp.]|uniref:IPTL-CTERM sorting domain-containing protein n=1 Tax=uncultured Thiohalocapsa sp. TaxID=768990 RepID=UPI0025F50C2C|nr:IPTL-CTERM sorting domain-containing protein [uncultured Thiohalocapsa sp.]